MGRLVHTGLGSSSLVAHVLHYPPPPTRTDSEGVSITQGFEGRSGVCGSWYTGRGKTSMTAKSICRLSLTKGTRTPKPGDTARSRVRIAEPCRQSLHGDRVRARTCWPSRIALLPMPFPRNSLNALPALSKRRLQAASSTQRQIASNLAP
jgi:hypothetical protein